MQVSRVMNLRINCLRPISLAIAYKNRSCKYKISCVIFQLAESTNNSYSRKSKLMIF